MGECNRTRNFSVEVKKVKKIFTKKKFTPPEQSRDYNAQPEIYISLIDRFNLICICTIEVAYQEYQQIEQ